VQATAPRNAIAPSHGRQAAQRYSPIWSRRAPRLRDRESVWVDWFVGHFALQRPRHGGIEARPDFNAAFPWPIEKGGPRRSSSRERNGAKYTPKYNLATVQREPISGTGIARRPGIKDRRPGGPRPSGFSLGRVSPAFIAIAESRSVSKERL
jgi:hypothetical protein